MRLRSYIVFLYLFMVLSSPCIFALELIKGGKVRAEIILTEKNDPVKTLAAEELKKYLFLLTGKEFTVTNIPSKRFPVKIHIGENIYTGKLGYKIPVFRKSGYDIDAGKNYIILNGPVFIRRKGKIAVLHQGTEKKYPFSPAKSSFVPHKELALASSDDPGVLYAVTAFLEKLGIRFYGPGRENTYIPEVRKDLSFPEGRITSESCFALREYIYGNGKDFDKETVLWLKHLKSGCSLQTAPTLSLAPVAPAYYLQPHLRSRFFRSAEGFWKKQEKRGAFVHGEYWHIPDMEESIKYFEYSFRTLPQIRKEQKKYFSGFYMLLTAKKKNTFLRSLPLRSLMIYMNSKLLWDPMINTDEILQEYCRNMYKEAAPEMLAFYRTSAKIWERKRSRAMKREGHFMCEKDLKILAGILSEAKKRAAARPEALDRILMYEKYGKFLAEELVLTPQGKKLPCTVFPLKSKVDLDETKYKDKPLAIGKNAQLFFGVKENRRELFFLLKYKNPFPKGKKFLLAVNTPYFSHFEITIDENGNIKSAALDPELLNGIAYPELFFKNIPFKTKKTSLYTIMEFSLDRYLGKGPSKEFPWGLTACFGKKSEMNKKLLLPKKDWYRLIAPSTDSKGNKLDSFHKRILTPADFQEPNSYVIRKTREKDFLSSPWNGKVWGQANTAHLAVRGLKAGTSEKSFCSKVAVKLLHDNKYIYGLFKVDDKYVKAVCDKDQGGTCLDSCVEIFLRPGGKGSYYNFEFNCIGKLLCWEMDDYWNRLFDPLTAAELKSIKRFHTLKGIIAEEIKKETRWFLGFQIPVEIFVKRNAVELPLSGQIWTGAFMKCAAGTSHTNSLSWKNMETFHWPEDFGALIFE